MFAEQPYHSYRGDMYMYTHWSSIIIHMALIYMVRTNQSACLSYVKECSVMDLPMQCQYSDLSVAMTIVVDLLLWIMQFHYILK